MKKIILLLFLVIFSFVNMGFGFSDGPKDIAKKFIQALFERRYEDASQYSLACKNEDKEYDKYDNWMSIYFNPTNLKVIRNKKSKKDGSDIVIMTFNYTNSNNAKSVERVSVKIIKEKSKLKIKKVKFSTWARRQRAKRRKRYARRPAYSAPTQRRTYSPVTIPQNSLPSGGIFSSLMSNPSKMSALMSGPVMEMMGDPDVMALVSDPKFKEITNDPSVLAAVMSGNMSSLQNNPKIRALMSDPRLNRLMKKYQNSSSGSNSMKQILNVFSK